MGALCYWRQNPGYIDEAIYAWPPGDEIELGMEVMMRTLQGQGPRIQSILVGPATKNFDEIKAILNEDCDRNSTGWDNPGMENGLQDLMLKHSLTILLIQRNTI